MVNKDEFDTLFKEYYYPLKLYARRFVLDNDVSDDIVQDVFYTIWKMKESITLQKPVGPYFFSAIYHKCLNYLKHKNVVQKYNEKTRYSGPDVAECYSNFVVADEDSLISSEFITTLKKHISELPEQCQRIFLLSRKFGLKNREIADFLQISVKVVEKQIAKALQVLYDKLKEKG